MPSTPHYLRVARALALVSGLAGLPACAMSSTLGADSGPRPDASETDPDSGGPVADAGDPVLDASDHPVYDAGHPVDDAGLLVDAGWVDPCATCECGGWAPVDSGTTAETCESLGHTECCAVIGPLFPPDLAA